MKIRLASLLVLLAALSASAFAAPSSATLAAPAAYAFTVEIVRQGQHAEIVRGTSQMTVCRLMGPAQRELSPNVWAFAGYHPHVKAGEDRGCDTLLITFTDGRVSELKIVNARAAQIIAAQLKEVSSGTMLAKK